MVAPPSVSYQPEGVQVFSPGPLPLPPFFALSRVLDFWTWIYIVILVLVFPLISYYVLKPVSTHGLLINIVYAVASFFRQSFMEEFYNLKGFKLFHSGPVLIGVYILLGIYLMITNIITLAYTCNLQACIWQYLS